MAAQALRSPLPWLAAAGALLLAVSWAFQSDGTRSENDVRPRPDGGGTEGVPQTGWTSPVDRRAVADDTARASWATDTVFTTDAEVGGGLRVESPSDWTRVRGSFVLLDAHGVEHPREDGSFDLSVWGPVVPQGHPADPGRRRLRRQHVTPVEVEGGRFEARVPAHTSRRIARSRLGGMSLFDLRVEELESDAPETTELRVIGRALYPARISVVDAQTSRGLEAVWAVALERDDPRSHPGDSAPTAGAASSPLVIPARGVDRQVYLIGAADHAWRRVEWNHLSEAERVVELARAGGLVVFVTADCSLADCDVTLSVTGHDREFARLAADGPSPLLVRGVPPGEYEVALVPRASFVATQAARLAETRTVVTADGLAEVTLHGSIGELPEAVELACDIRMSTEWSPGGPHVVVRASGRTALWHMQTGGILGGVETTGGDGTWRVRSPAAAAGGTYVLSERRTGFVRELEPGPAGSREHVFEIPDPISLRVDVVDHESGQLLPESELDWLPPAPPDVPRPSANPLWIEPTENAGAFEARVPAWELLEFEARAAGYLSVRATFEPVAGARVRIALVRE